MEAEEIRVEVVVGGIPGVERIVTAAAAAAAAAAEGIVSQERTELLAFLL